MRIKLSYKNLNPGIYPPHLFVPIRSNSVHFSLIRSTSVSIQSTSIPIGPIWSTFIQYGLFCHVQSNLVISGIVRSNSVYRNLFGPFRSNMIQFSPFSPIQSCRSISTSVQFGLISPLHFIQSTFD